MHRKRQKSLTWVTTIAPRINTNISFNQLDWVSARTVNVICALFLRGDPSFVSGTLFLRAKCTSDLANGLAPVNPGEQTQPFASVPAIGRRGSRATERPSVALVLQPLCDHFSIMGSLLVPFWLALAVIIGLRTYCP